MYNSIDSVQYNFDKHEMFKLDLWNFVAEEIWSVKWKYILLSSCI